MTKFPCRPQISEMLVRNDWLEEKDAWIPQQLSSRPGVVQLLTNSFCLHPVKVILKVARPDLRNDVITVQSYLITKTSVQIDDTPGMIACQVRTSRKCVPTKVNTFYACRLVTLQALVGSRSAAKNSCDAGGLLMCATTRPHKILKYCSCLSSFFDWKLGESIIWSTDHDSCSQVRSTKHLQMHYIS